MNDFGLFAHGEEFDVDAFLTSTTLRPDYVWRRGDHKRYGFAGGSGHPTSGVEFVLGDGLPIPFPKQDSFAIAYLEAHRDELRSLARLPGVDWFILALQYRETFEMNVVGFCFGPSARLMWHCLDVGCTPKYYVTLERPPEPEVEYAP